MQKVQKWSNYIEGLVIFCCVGIWLIGCSVAMGMMEKEKHIQQEIADKVIRFHVIANSDSQEDQQQKLEVRDAVVAALEPVLEGCSGADISYDGLFSRNYVWGNDVSRRGIRSFAYRNWRSEGT